jgi:hypothetical protein
MATDTRPGSSRASSITPDGERDVHQESAPDDTTPEDDSNQVSREQTSRENIPQQSVQEEIDQGDAVDAVDAVAAIKRSVHQLWAPSVLQRTAILLFIATFLIILFSIIALFIASKKKNGLASVNSKDYYLWTYGPTAGKTPYLP